MFDRIQEFLDKPVASLGSSVCLAVTAEVSERAQSSIVATGTSLAAFVTAGCIAVYWAHKIFLIGIGYYLRWRAGEPLLPVRVKDDSDNREAPEAE